MKPGRRILHSPPLRTGHSSLLPCFLLSEKLLSAGNWTFFLTTIPNMGHTWDDVANSKLSKENPIRDLKSSTNTAPALHSRVLCDASECVDICCHDDSVNSCLLHIPIVCHDGQEVARGEECVKRRSAEMSRNTPSNHVFPAARDPSLPQHCDLWTPACHQTHSDKLTKWPWTEGENRNEDNKGVKGKVGRKGEAALLSERIRNTGAQSEFGGVFSEFDVLAVWLAQWHGKKLQNHWRAIKHVNFEIPWSGHSWDPMLPNLHGLIIITAVSLKHGLRFSEPPSFYNKSCTLEQNVSIPAQK